MVEFKRDPPVGKALHIFFYHQAIGSHAANYAKNDMILPSHSQGVI